nr:DUF177 domain-containing protein [uncultured Sphingomonas sp.]
MSDFAHRLMLDQIRGGDRLDLVADDDERARIADRLGLVSLGQLRAHAAVEREGPQVRAMGRIQASLEQACVATGEPVAAMVDEPFDLLFLPVPAASGKADEEIELGEGEMDTVFYDGGAIDLGSAIADTLSLSLDPFPRSANADAALREAGVLSEEEAGPFAALAALKGKLSGE